MANHLGRGSAATLIGSLCGHPYRRDFARDEQIATGRGFDLVERDPRRNLAQRETLFRHLEEPEVGDNEVDHAACRGRDCTTLDEPRTAVTRLVLHRNKDMLGA